MCDGGNIATTEPNALRDLVEAPSWMTKLLGGVGLPGSSPSLGPARPSAAKSLSSSSAVAIPWRRANVRHTSNEMYVDILETLHVTLSPSGRPLVASAHGTLAFTCKVSGIPDLFLKLAAPGGSLASLIQLPVFHPCVRLAHWRSRPGEFSFVPPDGRFLLAGYEVDLLGADYLERALANPNTPSPLQLPASVELRTGLGAGGAEFEARLLLNAKFAGGTREASFAKPALGGRTGGTSAHPVVEDVVVRVPIAPGVRNLTEVRASRGEAHYAPGDAVVEWRIAGKDTAALSGGLHSSASGVVATLRCGLVGGLEEEGETSGLEVRSETWEYDGEEGGTYQAEKEKEGKKEEQNSKRARAIQTLMPTSATVSFQVKGWLASGIKVEKLVIDTQRSKGLGAGVQPYKGVKYITVSKEGVEARA
ncbi:clathrin adaptor, mu subunit [Trichodelitschia bisporula]|uniref:Clathrin adaptor, mu subunit n=1 Tax=Trichodelitschia bisporula TaxID=703511 RepID=A0A6G1HX01_9PEZI|nr:clathrin adaptor, mu subunit [Trichodelitschia bisporula]